MEIIAIGPRDRNKVYAIAANHLHDFRLETSECHQADTRPP